MLYRETGRVVHHQRAGVAVVLTRLVYRPGRRFRDRRKKELGIEPSPFLCPREPQSSFAGKGWSPESGRPRPGIDTPVWDHDPIRLFELYLCGHWSEFTWPRLLAAIKGLS